MKEFLGFLDFLGFLGFRVIIIGYLFIAVCLFRVDVIEGL
jgi:hypothetical protein